MGAFDDLIPKKGGKATPKRGGAFDDLLPTSDFGGVQSRVDSTEDMSGGYGGPLLAPSVMPEVSAPTLESINAANRAYMASPQMAQDKAAFERSQAAAKKREFQALPAPARGLIGAGARVGSWGRGANQLYATAADYIAPGEAPRLAGAQAAEEAARAQDSYMDGDMAASIGGIGADVISAAIPLSRVGQAGALARYGTSAAAGAGMGALAPTVEGESRLLNAGVGLGLGVVGQGASDALAAIGKAATPEIRALYTAAKARGIQLTPAQLTDSAFVRRLAHMLDAQPMSGAAARREAQTKQVNSEVAKLIDQTGDVVDQPMMARASDQMGQEYDQLFAQGVQFDRQFLKDIAQIKRTAAQQMDDTAQRTINNLASRVRKQGAGGFLPGRSAQSIDRNARLAATGGGDRQAVAQEFRTALSENLERTAGAAQKDAIKDLNRRYATYKTIEPLVARNPEGGISPQQILGAVNSTKRGRSAMARGRAGDLGELAKIGQRMKPPSSSGTAENLAARDWNNPFSWPLLLARSGVGAVGSRAVNSGLLADYLMSAGRGQSANLLAPYLRPASIGLLPYFQDAEDPSDRP